MGPSGPGASGGAVAAGAADAPKTSIRPSVRAVIRRTIIVMAGASVLAWTPGRQQSFARSGARAAATARVLEVLRRHHDGAPHVRRRTRVPPEPFLRLPEVAAHHVRELLELHLHGGIEGVEVIDADQPRTHVPRVIARVLVVAPDVRIGLIVGAEELDIHLRVLVADRLVREEAERLVIPDGPGDFFVD